MAAFSYVRFEIEIARMFYIYLAKLYMFNFTPRCIHVNIIKEIHSKEQKIQQNTKIHSEISKDINETYKLNVNTGSQTENNGN